MHPLSALRARRDCYYFHRPRRIIGLCHWFLLAFPETTTVGWGGPHSCRCLGIFIIQRPNTLPWTTRTSVRVHDYSSGEYILSRTRLNGTSPYHLAIEVFAVFGCFVALLVKAGPVWSQVFMGFLPDKGLFQSDPDAVYAGKLGTTLVFARNTDTVDPGAQL